MARVTVADLLARIEELEEVVCQLQERLDTTSEPEVTYNIHFEHTPVKRGREPVDGQQMWRQVSADYASYNEFGYI